MALHITLEERNQKFLLRFTSDNRWDDEFKVVLAQLKDQIQAKERTWDVEHNHWAILATSANERKLESLFPTFSAELAAIRSQISLF